MSMAYVFTDYMCWGVIVGLLIVYVWSGGRKK
jgi:hypothetical protein